jgi:PGF-pre-PGF domain-containing protein
MRKFVLVSLVAVFVGIAAGQTPSFPHVVEGDVTVNGEDYTGALEARAGGSVLDSTSIENGGFGESTDPLLVPGGAEEFTLYVDGLKSDQTLTFESGATDTANIEISTDEEESTKVSKTISEDNEDVSVDVPETVSDGKSSGVQKVTINVDQDSDESVKEVNVTVSENVEENTGEVGEIPVEDQDENVHGNIDVDTDNNDAVENAEIDFKVRQERVSETSQVVLYHFDEGDLVEVLETSYLEDVTDDKDNEFYYFESETTSFSSFTIASDTEDPEAVLDADQTDIEPGETVEFDGSGSSDDETGITGYAWDFGDGEGTGGNETIISHTFDDTGTYTVELTVSDQAGNEDTETVDISVEEPDTGGGGSVTTDTTGDDSTDSSDEDESEPDTQDQTEESSEQDDSSGDQQEDTTQDDGSSDQGDTSVEDSEQDAEDQTETQQTPDTPTGQFFTSDTGIASGLLILLVVLVVYLEYTGRIELRELKEVIKQKASN